MGSGKSTLLYALAALLPLERGSVTVDDKPFSQADRRRAGILFQNPDDQLFNATVYDDVAYSLRTAGADEAEERALEVSERLGDKGPLGPQPLQAQLRPEEAGGAGLGGGLRPRVPLVR
ncbi:ATP-binding cassette domain-containing protein [Ignicoccus hospitalis]|uniref:ATP-binding cassette domain-containing protein n=1 Tax=Ignicoccus hospitalis TaxID=160233 RepID=UPI003B82C634